MSSSCSIGSVERCIDNHTVSGPCLAACRAEQEGENAHATIFQPDIRSLISIQPALAHRF